MMCERLSWGIKRAQLHTQSENINIDTRDTVCSALFSMSNFHKFPNEGRYGGTRPFKNCTFTYK